MSDPLTPKRGIVLGTKRAAPPALPAAPEEPAVRFVPFPTERTYLWLPEGFSGGLPDADIVVAPHVLLDVNQHVSESLEREIGGFLLGNRYRCPVSQREYVIIDQFSPARSTEATSVSLSFTAEAWAGLAEEMGGKFHGKILIGWYHSHPRMHIFLSQHDIQIHEQRFSDTWKSALVLEPYQRLGGFFGWHNGKLDSHQPVPFYELLPSSRETAMPWTHYQCVDPATNRTIEPPRATGAAITVAAVDSMALAEPAGKNPVSQPFPFERTYHWFPTAASPDIPPLEDAIVVSQEVLDAVNRCVSASLEVEIGGFLLGNRYYCPNSGRTYVIIDQYSPAQFTEATGVSLSFTAEAWGKMHEELRGKFLGKLLVGWYHSHPRMGIFLSSWDVQLHEQRFLEPWTVALVIEPEKQLGGFFCRRGGRIDPRVPVDFYEDVGVAGGPSVVRWSDHFCRDQVNDQVVEPPRTSAAVARPLELPSPARRISATISPATALEAARRSAKVVGPPPPQKKQFGMNLFVGLVAFLALSGFVVAFFPGIKDAFHKTPPIILAGTPQLVDPSGPQKGIQFKVQVTNARSGYQVQVGSAKVPLTQPSQEVNLIDSDSSLIAELNGKPDAPTRKDPHVQVLDQKGRTVAETTLHLPPALFVVSQAPAPQTTPQTQADASHTHDQTITKPTEPAKPDPAKAVPAGNKDNPLAADALSAAESIETCMKEHPNWAFSCGERNRDAVRKIQSSLPKGVPSTELTEAIIAVEASRNKEDLRQAAKSLRAFAAKSLKAQKATTAHTPAPAGKQK